MSSLEKRRKFLVGLFIVHPATTHLPAVDRDFFLITQEFQLRPNSSVPDTLAMEWNYLSFNGRCGPYTTPMLCKLGERARIRFVNFSVIDHHPTPARPGGLEIPNRWITPVTVA